MISSSVIYVVGFDYMFVTNQYIKVTIIEFGNSTFFFFFVTVTFGFWDNMKILRDQCD